MYRAEIVVTAPAGVAATPARPVATRGLVAGATTARASLAFTGVAPPVGAPCAPPSGLPADCGDRQRFRQHRWNGRVRPRIIAVLSADARSAPGRATRAHHGGSSSGAWVTKPTGVT